MVPREDDGAAPDGERRTVDRLSVDYARHAVEKLAIVTLGALAVSPAGRALRARLDRLGPEPRRPPVRAALIAHVYYVELIDEILACRARLPRNAPLHLTVPFERLEALRARVEGLPDIVLHPCENRGRDIAPFLAVLGSGALDGYDAVLKLHTKRSPHLIDGETRRKLLFDTLCGSERAVLRTLALFEAPATGLVGWRGSYRARPFYWMRNEARVRVVAARMGAAGHARLGLFEGSMFWFRPAALVALRELALTAGDFEPEARQTDGALHHAIERCFAIAAWARGFTVRSLGGRALG